MKILLAGGSGFIGTALLSLLNQEHEVTVLSRSLPGNKKTVNWQNLDTVNGFDVIINLSGENIGEKRWNTERKKSILTSRMTTTLKLAHLCAIANPPKPRLLNASAIGIYGSQPEQPNGLPLAFDENSVVNFTSPPDFLADVATAWEQATSPALKAGCEVTWLRFGVVLDKRGGALKKLLPAFQLGLGSVLGSGKQVFTWISLHDAVRAIAFIIEKKIKGPICVVAPHAITQREFAKALAQSLHRPCVFSLPKGLVHFIFGEMGDALLLQGQHVKPVRLQELGFKFHASRIEEALV